ncbi:hypothetical protein [Actinocorallia libanotica]|uniref:hypothetical protein n=1 Tax=Actinocorallia libanotica TaxID=46162 RepID=UPI0031D3B6F3
MRDGWRLRLLAWALRLHGVRSLVRMESWGVFLVADCALPPLTVSVRVEGGAVLWMFGPEEVVIGQRLLSAAAVVAWLCSVEGMRAFMGGGCRE